ncbi:hypothetical protein VTN02DRAFT_2672 [Thermoascus thermophilus]
MAGLNEENRKKRKLQDVEEIEIDVSAPEPPSKKALRKAKKKQKAVEEKKETSAEPQTQTSDSQSKPAKKKKRSDYGIWIGNLPFSATKADLRKFLTSKCSFGDSTITRVHLPTGPGKDGKAQNKGFAYIDLADSKAVQEAVGLSEQLLSGRPVLIKDAKNFDGRPEKHQEGEASNTAATAGKPPSRRIFIGNLGFDATKELLEEHFSRCGAIANVHVATFEDSGKCKGYAWVEFEEQEAAEAAVKGFVMVKEDEEEDEQEEDSSDDESSGSDYEDRGPSKAKQPKLKRVWVNRFLGRKLRMEFAEDPATRYKKRFGKEGKGKNNSSQEEAVVEAEPSEVNGGVDGDTGAQNARATKEKGFKKGKKKETESLSRYSKETVQRLTGAIVESQGKKTTFD